MGVHHAHSHDGRPKSYVVTEIAGETNASENTESFLETVTIVSTAAGTAVVIIPDARVGPGRKVYIQGVRGKVNGATAWTTLTSLFLEDTTQVAFLTMAAAALTGNAVLTPTTANVTPNDPYILNTGGTAGGTAGLGAGLQLRANVNAGAGSSIVLTVYGQIKG